MNQNASQSVESSVSSEYTIKPSDEFFHVFKLSYKFNMNKSTLSDKEIKTIEAQVDKLYNEVTNSENATLNDIVTLAYSYQNICHGYIKSNQKKELLIGRTYILRCLNLVKSKELDSKFIIIALEGHYQLGFIYFKQKKSGKALQTCNKAIELYLTYTDDKKKYGNPIHFKNISIQPSIDGYYMLNRIHIEILKLITEADIDMDVHTRIVYRHLDLAANLNILQETRKHISWVYSALKVFYYLIKYDRFAEARNHIITAIYVKNIFLDILFRNTNKQILSLQKLNELYINLDIIFNAACKKYWVRLLRRSVERLLRLEKGEEIEFDDLNSGHPTKLEGDISQRLLLFNDIDTEISFECVYPFLPVKYILHYNDAYKIFINFLRSFSILKFSIDKKKEEILTYGQLILDSFEMYKYMAFYEKDITNRSLLQNMIIPLLSKALDKKVLLQYAPAFFYKIQLHLAISYSHLIDIKLENLDAIHPLYMPQRYNAIELEIECLVKYVFNCLEALIVLQKIMPVDSHNKSNSSLVPH
ncbi:uncharacterized protein LOC116840353 isoform X2 [Odontomachus brunneus]|uniref:uncharacterized protein LOC116840353 isoform X2 n=1 Tax=Odontomachus brunneus TaxID=486640 RepID=UPI0013F24FEC|nr:uncharacterized protein LOC116840353 isoform X2 [Odontomachus brunneus]